MGQPGWLVSMQTLVATMAMLIHSLAAAAHLGGADASVAALAGAVTPLAAEADWLVIAPPPDAEPAAPELPAEPPRHAVPILMYHVIAPGPDNLHVPPAELEAQLRLLSEHGYETVSMQHLASHFAHGTPLPERPIVLTFDDGYISAYTAALPLLQQYGMTATFFIVTGLVGQAGYVTWDHVAALAAAGMEIGAHTVSHPDLRGLTGAALLHEVAGSGQALEGRLGLPVSVFAYPAGKYNAEAVAAVRDHYEAAVTTLPGAATPCQDPVLWHRIRVNQGVSAQELLDIIAYWDRQPACR